MPKVDGLEVTRRLLAPEAASYWQGTPPRIVIVTTFDLDEYVHTALHHGASGFLRKDSSPAMLVEAVRAAAVGDSLISPAITVRLLRTMAASAATGSATRQPSEALTHRAADVARCLARGLTNAEIASELFRTGPPVLLHVENGLAARVPPDVAAGVHRIVRESLTNVVKHAADATAVRIAIRPVPDGLEVRIADDGTKAARLTESARGGGFGLVGLTERAEALGGRLAAGPAPEGGWLVAAVLPLNRTASPQAAVTTHGAAPCCRGPGQLDSRVPPDRTRRRQPPRKPKAVRP
ncbi:hypothetical protein GCM10009753_11950 [Streptantibioticus ferralitis]